VTTTDGQARKLMEEMAKHGKVGLAAMRAGVDRKTARKYVKAGKLPSEMVSPRTWRTRSDPFAEVWDRLAAQLEQEPGLEAKTLFEVLREEHPGRYEPGQLRTLQRHVRQWRAQRGPAREVMFTQVHRPGEACQVDFTEVVSLRVTIVGELFAHLLCVFVLPFSNWQWATVCMSESLAALRRGIQAALFQLGGVPEFSQTDNSTAATHRIPSGQEAQVEGHRRPFNAEYLALVRHFGMKARTTEIGAKEQNGDVEASHRALKARLEQALLVRGHRDFESRDAWQSFVHDVLRKANAGRGERVQEELATLRPLTASRLPEFIEEDVRVNAGSTIRVHCCAYSVPSRLIGEAVRVRLYEDRLEVHFAGDVQLACERLRGDKRHRIDYRHVIWSLVRKPGAFARYVYREEMFPSLTFRRSYDAIVGDRPGVRADLEYLRILHLAASTLEADVQAALDLLLAEKQAITVDAVKVITAGADKPEVPELEPEPVDLASYDELLMGVGA
jgi:hypothetical protein